MDDYYDYADDWDVTDDPGFEDAARQWADENSNELVGAYAEGDLVEATIAAHQATWQLVERSVARAKAREASDDWDEAAFHYSRALEGYVRAVYLEPLFGVMTRAFDERLKVSKLVTKDIVPAQLRNAKRLLLFALVGMTTDTKEAIAVKNAIAKAVASPAWDTRNGISHTLHMPEPAEVAALEKEVRAALAAASKPLVDRIAADEARRLTNAAERRHALGDL